MSTSTSDVTTEPVGDHTGPAPAAQYALWAALIGGAVSVALGVYGRMHDPTFETIIDFGFSGTLPMKAWFTTFAAVLLLFQVFTAGWMWERIPNLGAAPRWAQQSHRWTGTAAFLLTLPAAYHCLWALGYQTTTTRVVVHSTLGCAFYGAFTVKMLGLHSKRVPSVVLPIAGALLAVILAAIWFTSALWYFQNFGFPSF
jgi:hypothetical protein